MKRWKRIQTVSYTHLVTGAADPTVSARETLKGKLPQKNLTRGAAKGYSSYGNQIGLATGYVKEIYHPNYVAKRMEIGAVMGAAPRRAVIRENSDPGDIIIPVSYTHLGGCVCPVQAADPAGEKIVSGKFRGTQIQAVGVNKGNK